MAIDFSRYAGNYGGRGGAGGGGGGGNPLAQGMRDIGKAMGTYREREQWKRDDAAYKKTKKAEAFAKWRKGYFSTAYSTALGTGSFSSSDDLKTKAQKFKDDGGWDDQTQSWADFKRKAKNVTIDGETYDFSKDIDAMAYAGDYQKLHQNISGQWLNQIGSLELDPNISQREIRKIMKANPAFFNYLKTFNADQFRTGGTYEGYTPQQTWGEWFGDEERLYNDPGGYLNEMSGLTATAIAGTGGLAWWKGPALFNWLKGRVGSKEAAAIIKSGENNPAIRASVGQSFKHNVTQGNLFNQATTPGTGGRPQGVIDAIKKGAKEIVKNGQRFIKYADGSVKSFASFTTPGMTSQQIYGTGGGASSTSRVNQRFNQAGGTKGLKEAAGRYWDDVTKTWKSSVKLPTSLYPSAVNVARGVGTIGMPMALGYGVEKLTGNENLGQVANKGAFAGMTLTPVISGISKIVNKHGWKAVSKKILQIGGPKLFLSAVGKLTGGVLGGSVSAGVIGVGMTAWAMKDLYDIYKILNEEYGTNDQGNKNVLKQQNKAISQLSNNPAAMSDFSPELRAAYGNLT